VRFSQRVTTAAAAALAMVFSAPPALASGYTGSWPVTITHSQRSDGTGCLTLTGYAGGGGRASLVFGSQKYTYGSFVVVNGILVANITEPLYGQNGALMFIAHASRGHIGQGVFENIEGGSNFDYGALAFGIKNGC
jgi:hypothetical protein